MKNLVATLVLLAVISAATGVAFYRAGSNRPLHEAAARRDALLWLKTDFQLDDSQFAAIRALHESYSGTCDEHCRRIQEATRIRKALLAAHATPGDLQAADRQIDELKANCEHALTVHVRMVAALMAPEQGRRYLDIVLPKIAQFDHLAAPDVRLDRTL